MLSVVEPMLKSHWLCCWIKQSKHTLAKVAHGFAHVCGYVTKALTAKINVVSKVTKLSKQTSNQCGTNVSRRPAGLICHFSGTSDFSSSLTLIEKIAIWAHQQNLNERFVQLAMIWILCSCRVSFAPQGIFLDYTPKVGYSEWCTVYLEGFSPIFQGSCVNKALVRSGSFEKSTLWICRFVMLLLWTKDFPIKITIRHSFSRWLSQLRNRVKICWKTVPFCMAPWNQTDTWYRDLRCTESNFYPDSRNIQYVTVLDLNQWGASYFGLNCSC